jgi:hypothetical protein
MTRSDRARRAVSLTLAVLCLMLAPQLAFAHFSSSKAPTLSVSAGRLVTPTAVTGTYTCRTGFRTEGADVNVTGFSVVGQPSGVSYVYTLYRGTSQQATTTTTAKLAPLSTGLDSSDGLTNTTYRLTIASKVGLWTVAAYSRSFICGGMNPGSGQL